MENNILSEKISSFFQNRTIVKKNKLTNLIQGLNQLYPHKKAQIKKLINKCLVNYRNTHNYYEFIKRKKYKKDDEIIDQLKKQLVQKKISQIEKKLNITSGTIISILKDNHINKTNSSKLCIDDFPEPSVYFSLPE